GMRHAPATRTYVGRFVVEKKFSGSTPSAGAGTNVASGAWASSGAVKSGGVKFGTEGKVARGSPWGSPMGCPGLPKGAKLVAFHLTQEWPSCSSISYSSAGTRNGRTR